MFTAGVCLQIKGFWTVPELTVTSRNSSSSSSLTVRICCLPLLWSPVYTCFHVFFYALVSVVSDSLFKPHSVSEFLFFRYSFSASDIFLLCLFSSDLLSTLFSILFRDLLFVSLSCDLCCIFHALLCPCLLKEGKKSSALFLNVCLTLFITMGW